MTIYKVYTDHYYNGEECKVKFYLNKDTAEKDKHKRLEDGDEAHLEEVDVIND
jgi:hypothetical protein